MIDFRWPVSDTDDKYKGHGVINVELSVYHSKHDKAYHASVNPITVWDNGWTSKSFSFQGPHWSMGERVERYSRKTLDAFAERALAAFADAVASGHEISGLFGVQS